MKKHQHRGFTLIEVMIAVAIVGILSAIAYPSYTEYIRRGHRADARAGLLQAQQYLERASTATGVYPTTLPPALKWLLPDGTTPDPTKRYEIPFWRVTLTLPTRSRPHPKDHKQATNAAPIR